MLGIYVSVPIACFRKGLAREYLETEAIPPPSTCYGFLLSLVGDTDRSRHIGARVGPVMLSQPDLSVVLRTVWRIKSANAWQSPKGGWHMFSDNEQKHFRRWQSHAMSESLLERDSSDLDQSWLQAQEWSSYVSEWLRKGKPEIDKESADDVKQRLGKDRAKKLSKWMTDKSELVPCQGTGTNSRPDYQQLLSGIELVIWVDSGEETKADGPNLETRIRDALDKSRRSTIERFGGLSMGESTHLVDEVSVFTADQNRNGQSFLLASDGRLTLPVWVDHVGSAKTRFVTGNLELSPLVPPSAERLPKVQPKA